MPKALVQFGTFTLPINSVLLWLCWSSEISIFFWLLGFTTFPISPIKSTYHISNSNTEHNARSCTPVHRHRKKLKKYIFIFETQSFVLRVRELHSLVSMIYRVAKNSHYSFHNVLARLLPCLEGFLTTNFIYFSDILDTKLVLFSSCIWTWHHSWWLVHFFNNSFCL